MKRFSFKISLVGLIILAALSAVAFVIGSLTVGSNILKVSLGFIPDTLMGSIGGPFWAGLALAVNDVVGVLLHGGSYFPGFTFSAFIVGILYGLFFYKKRLGWGRWQDWLYVLAAVAVIMIVQTGFFNSLWVAILYKLPFGAAFTSRAIAFVQIPIRAIIIMLILPALQQIPQVAKFMDLPTAKTTND